MLFDIRKQITLDFQRRNNVRVVYATQSDMNCRVLVIKILDDGEVYPIHKNSGAIAAINVLRPDGKSSSFPAKITDIGEVTYEMTAWPLGVAGEVKMSLALHDSNGDRLATDPFILYVAEGLYLGSQVEEDDQNQTAFANMMAELAAINLKEEMRQDYETQRQEDEFERRNNEFARSRQEDRREDEENKRVNAENGRYNEELVRKKNEQERIANEAERAANDALRCQVTDALLQGLDNLLALQEEYINSIPGGES